MLPGCINAEFSQSIFFINLRKLRDKGISNSLFDTSVGIYNVVFLSIGC